MDLNVKNLAVITARHHGIILESRFLTDHGLDQQRYRHLRRVAKKQWQSGKAVKGEQSNVAEARAKGERFSVSGGQRVRWKGGKLFWCPVCHDCANADYNGSANLHHSLFAEFCWHPKAKRKRKPPL